MKNFLLRRERIFHFFFLILIALSLFLQVPEQKMAMLVTGILGLLLLSVLKKQKILAWVYALLVAAACLFYYLMVTGKINSF